MQNDQQQKTVTSNSSFVYSHVWVHQYTNKSKQHIWWNTERKTAKLHKQLVWLTKQCNGIVQTLLYTTCNATEENVYIDGMFANEIESINNIVTQKDGHWYNNQYIYKNPQSISINAPSQDATVQRL